MGLPILDTIIDVIKGPLDKLVPDKNKQKEFEHEIAKSLLNSGKGQLQVNAVEAAHRSIFVAGWRPAVGWVCALALLWHFMLFDLAAWLQIVFFPETPALPKLSGTGELITVLMSMLGLGGLRSFEKYKGVTR